MSLDGGSRDDKEQQQHLHQKGAAHKNNNNNDNDISKDITSNKFKKYVSNIKIFFFLLLSSFVLSFCILQPAPRWHTILLLSSPIHFTFSYFHFLEILTADIVYYYGTEVKKNLRIECMWWMEMVELYIYILVHIWHLG